VATILKSATALFGADRRRSAQAGAHVLGRDPERERQRQRDRAEQQRV
jgi:hypothetical protein